MGTLTLTAALSPNDAWQQPLPRAGDTAVGIVVGLVAYWLAGSAHLLDHRRGRPVTATRADTGATTSAARDA